MAEKNELMTIKAFAEASGRSQQAIYKQINTRLSEYLHEIDGQKYVERRALFEVFHIGEEVEQCNLNSTKPQKASADKTLEILERTVQMLDEQLKAKDEEIRRLTEAIQEQAKSISGAQALHAGTMQQLLPETASEGDAEPVEVVETEEVHEPTQEPPDTQNSLQEVVRELSWWDIIKLKFGRKKDTV